MIYEKPKNEIFASDAKDGEIVDFPNIKRGWGVTENLGFIPPMEYFNAAFNRVDKSIAYQMQRGVAEWDKDLEYPIGAVVSLNGVVYVAKSQNINKNPANEATIWDIAATQKWCEDSFFKKTDKIDAYNKTESDKKFALKDDLPPFATEEKEGIAKLKNIVNAKQTDAAVTEKAVSDLFSQIDFRCAARVIFNGQGSVSIIDSKNISSIVKNGVGDYTIKFLKPMEDTNYYIFTSLEPFNTASPNHVAHPQYQGIKRDSLRIITGYGVTAFSDEPRIQVMIFIKSK